MVFVLIHERSITDQNKTQIKDNLCLDFICVPKERRVVISGIAISLYQNEEIICFGIPIIFEMNFRLLIAYSQLFLYYKKLTILLYAINSLNFVLFQSEIDLQCNRYKAYFTKLLLYFHIYYSQRVAWLSYNSVHISDLIFNPTYYRAIIL